MSYNKNKKKQAVKLAENINFTKKVVSYLGITTTEIGKVSTTNGKCLPSGALDILKGNPIERNKEKCFYLRKHSGNRGTLFVSAYGNIFRVNITV